MVKDRRMADNNLRGRVAVVTGGGRGIGLAIVRGLASAGAAVAVAGRDRARLDAVVASLASEGARAVAVSCDVREPADVARLAETARRELGPVTIVVNNAGIARSAKLADTDEALWADTLAVNLTGAYRVTRTLLPDLLAAGARGRVINIASVAAKVGFAYTAAYCASKHGLLGFTRALALEIAPRGVTVNCVCPGWTDTDMAHDAIARIADKTGRGQGDARSSLESMSPQRRLMTAEEVAQVTVFLATDAARGVTGQAWNVDGGEVMF
jgi:NAD(P)-dependent dehydrogenase (short-subunit alcohol dehydrogenase family)